MVERSRNKGALDGQSEKEQGSDNVNQLCSVVRLSRGGYKGYSDRGPILAFIGWTADKRPTVVSEVANLDHEAKRGFEAYRQSGLPVKEVNFSSIGSVVEYLVVGDPVDFKDTDTRKAEDLVTLSVRDRDGNNNLALGEISILQGIIGARDTPWQDIGGSRLGGVARAKTMYAIFIQAEERTSGKATTIIFSPVIEGESNEATFQSFVRNTLGKLLILDELQEPKDRKGYIQAAAKISGLGETGGNMDFLMKLRKLGLIDFDDAWLQQKIQRRKSFSAKIIGFAELAGLIELTDEARRRIQDPLPDYDLDKMNISQLFKLAEEMFYIAQRQIGR